VTPTPPVADLRRSYERGELRESDLAPTWLEQFGHWLDDAAAGGVREPNAMVVATADADGRPSARTVLLKHVDERGFVLFTNLGSRKGRDALANPHAALVFPWHDQLDRQVVVTGPIAPVDPLEADAYWASRPHGSRLGALASPQSTVIPSRSAVTDRRAELERAHPAGTDVPRPAHWTGLRVAPQTVEFWQGRPDRLHDRLRFRADAGAPGGWVVERLAP
jgi:pyridoxamine 5'-phosphate oxidase